MLYIVSKSFQSNNEYGNYYNTSLYPIVNENQELCLDFNSATIPYHT